MPFWKLLLTTRTMIRGRIQLTEDEDKEEDDEEVLGIFKSKSVTINNKGRDLKKTEMKR